MVMSEIFINKETLIRHIMEYPVNDVSELMIHSIFQTYGKNINLHEEQ